MLPTSPLCLSFLSRLLMGCKPEATETNLWTGFGDEWIASNHLQHMGASKRNDRWTHAVHIYVRIMQMGFDSWSTWGRTRIHFATLVYAVANGGIEFLSLKHYSSCHVVEHDASQMMEEGKGRLYCSACRTLPGGMVEVNEVLVYHARSGRDLQP